MCSWKHGIIILHVGSLGIEIDESVMCYIHKVVSSASSSLLWSRVCVEYIKPDWEI